MEQEKKQGCCTSLDINSLQLKFLQFITILESKTKIKHAKAKKNQSQYCSG
jgi:hypothetical protein